jgi:flagellin-specific chaperone FliS
MMHQLTNANINDDPKPLEEVEKLLTTIKEGFEGAAEKIMKDTVPNSQNFGQKSRGLRIDI